MILALLFAFAAVAEPRVSSIAPSSGPATGGTYVIVNGSDLVGFALGCPAPECGTYVQFGGEMGTIVANDETQIVVKTPAHAAGLVEVIVNIGRVKLPIAGGFRYEEAADAELVHLLIPIAASGPGAFASQWRTDLAIHNATDQIVAPQGAFCNPLILAPCIQYLIEPHRTGHQQLYPLNGQPGAILTLPRTLADNIDVQLRVQDLSRQSQTWGTSIPVVRPEDFRRVVRLHAIPTDARFRDTLRIYGYIGDTVATVRIIDETNGAVLASTELNVAKTQDPTSYPPFAQITSLRDAFPQIASRETVGVEVEASLIWAFVAVTNNETQHVTVIAPQ
jgi:IPT/TIG domain